MEGTDRHVVYNSNVDPQLGLTKEIPCIDVDQVPAKLSIVNV